MLPGSFFSLRTRIISVSVALYAALAAFCFAYLGWRMFITLQNNGPGEFWNAWHALRWAEGLPLYPAPSEFIANNYPPLSFLLLGTVAKAGGDPILTGRILALVSIPVIAAAIAGCIAELGGSRRAAAFGTVWYAAATCIVSQEYVGMDDPNYPALAAMACGLWLFLRAERLGKSYLPALALMAVAGFYKHNVTAIPAMAIFWAFSTRGAKSVRPVAAAFALVLIGIGLCVSCFGPDFIAQMTGPRVVGLAHIKLKIKFMIWPALIVAAAWAVQTRHERSGRFAGCFLVISFVLYLVQRAGDGVSDNAQFELIVATALGLGLASDRLATMASKQGRIAGGAIAVFVLLAVSAAISFHHEPIWKILSPGYRADLGERIALAKREVERIRSIPGPVSCSYDDICLQAGKAFVIDKYAIRQRLRTHRLTSVELDAEISRRGIRFVRIDPRAAWPAKARQTAMQGGWPGCDVCEARAQR
jgi:hypothetical protein